MKFQALSHYSNDMDTRFGDCILLWENQSLTIFDCGHEKHAEEIERLLMSAPSVTNINIVISHNDCDHTSGACHLLDWLYEHKYNAVAVYTHQYLKHIDAILDKINDKRRTRESLKQALLEEFNNIRVIIETAQNYNFIAVEALKGTAVGQCTIKGPTVDQFVSVAAQAVDSRASDDVAGDHTEEDVMNAASVQLSGKLDNAETFLLCGDAHPDYLEFLDSYDIIQLPHHGQLEDAQAIFDQLSDPYSKVFFISDNTGSGEKSGGSDKLVQWMSEQKYSPAKNTKHGVVRLPEITASSVISKPQGVRLGGLDRQF